MANWPTALDLFSGVGGTTLGMRQARFRVIGAVDVEPLALQSYSLNFPSVGRWECDIRSLDPVAVMRELGHNRGELGLLAGCPPCQGFSSIRTRGGKTVRDPRNALVMEFLRFSEAMLPSTVLFENVPGVAEYRRFRALRSGLRQLGYELTWGVVDAADFGVPQRRHRLIMVGARGWKPQLPSPQSERVTVRGAIAGLAPAGYSGDPLHDVPERRSIVVQNRIRQIPRNGGSRSAMGTQQLACHVRTDGFKDVYGRMAWDSVAPTITGGCVNPSKGRFLHPEENRAITLREALLLQGFPSKYQVSLDRGKFAAAALIGNAVPPALVKAIAQELRFGFRGAGGGS